MPALIEEPRVLNVAVVGGGIGGLCAAIGLLKHPHINVQIYEAAHKFSEIGAGVMLGPNAEKALKLIDPNAEDAFRRQSTHNAFHGMKHTFLSFRMGQGPDEGKVIAAPKNESGQASVHRAKFLDELVALIPKEVAHFGKRLDQVRQLGEGQGVQLHFKDGTTATADCVLGADGVHSMVREHILGPDHPALKPQFTGSVIHRALIPMPEAVAALGAREAQNGHQWMGNDGVITTYPIDGGETLNIGLTSTGYTNWEGAWVQPANLEKIRADFADWGEFGHKLIDLIDRPTTMAYSLWDLPAAPTYYTGKAAMMGDAAHATTPFQAQGAGQAIEDAYVLSALFELVKKPEHIPLAFEAYDCIRRPRSLMVCKTSREAGELCALRLPGVLDDPVLLKENIEWRMDWMWHRDVEGERNEAVYCLEELLAGGSLDEC